MPNRITKRVVDDLRPGQTVWDGELRGFGVRKQRRDPTFVLKYSFRGRQRFYTIGRHGMWTAEGARLEARRLLGLLASGTDPANKRKTLSDKMSVADLCARYLADGPLHKPNKKASSWVTDGSNINRHIVPLLGHHAICELTDVNVVEFMTKVSRGDTKASERTGWRGRAIVKGGRGVAARALAVLGSVFNFGIALKLVTQNPVTGVKPPRGKKPGRFLGDEEWARLGTALDQARGVPGGSPMADVIYLLALTGCRKSEIARLRWREVDLQGGFLRLEDSKVGARIVPLGEAAIRFLEAKRLPTREWVFPSSKAAGPVVGIQKVWSKIRGDAGLPTLRLHDLRHSFASQAINSGASLYLTGAVLGHRQASTTERYAHLQSSPVKAVASATAAHIRDALHPDKD